MTDNLSCNCCFFYQAHFQCASSFRGIRIPAYLVERCQLGKEMPDEGVCEDFKKIDYGMDMMNDKTDNPEMIKVYKRLSMLLGQLESMLEDAEDLKQDIISTYREVNCVYNQLELIEYHQKEQEKHCNCCKKEVDES